MSSILKALKKLEEQKTEKKEGAVNIARDILRSSRKAKKAENWILPTAVVALLLTGAMVSYFLVGGFSPESETAPSPPVAASEQNEKSIEDSVAETALVDDEVEVGQGGSNPDESMAATADVAAEPSDKTTVPTVVDRPEAVFAGKSDQAPSERMLTQVKQVSTGVMDNQRDRTVAADGETARNQQQTAATLKETAQVLKETAEALREKAVQTRQAAFAARQAESSATASSEVKAASSVTTVRLSSSSEDAQGSEPPTRHIYRPSDSRAALSGLSKPAGETQEEALPRVLTSTTDSGKSRWSTSAAAGSFPDLTVSEIHYQYEVENRLAVVNDLPVMEGTVIDGARVDRILKDRVRFVFNGQYKEVRVSE